MMLAAFASQRFSFDFPLHSGTTHLQSSVSNGSARLNPFTVDT